MLSVKNLNMGYGDMQVLWDVSFEVNEGEIVVLVGANGAGKSSTLKTISGLNNPTREQLNLKGNHLQKFHLKR